MNKYSKEFKNKIVEEYNNGKSKADIKREYGLSFNTMNHWINNQNSIIVGNVKYSDEIKNTVLEEYKNGLSIKEISEKYLIMTGTLYSWIKTSGISKQKGVKSLCNNYTYFDCIDTELKAYFLGFIIADGNVSIRNNQYSLKISIQRQDRYLLEELLKELDCSNVINDYTKQTTFAKSEHDYSYVSITNKYLVSSLIKLNVIPRKTGKEKFPDIKEELIHHMIRGFFDGDGIASYTPNSKAFGFVGNKVIIEQIKFALDGKWDDVTLQSHWATEGLYQITSRKCKTIKALYDYMYTNATFCLERKKIKFEKALSSCAVHGQGLIEVHE